MSQLTQAYQSPTKNQDPKKQDSKGNTAFHRACMIDWPGILFDSKFDSKSFSEWCNQFVEIFVFFRAIGFSFYEVDLKKSSIFSGLEERCKNLLTRGEELTDGEHPVDILLGDAEKYKDLYEEMERYQDYHCTGLHAGEFEFADECRWTGNQQVNWKILEEYEKELLAPCEEAFREEILSHVEDVRFVNTEKPKDFPDLYPIEKFVCKKESPTWEYNPSFFESSVPLNREDTAFDIRNNKGKRPVDLILGL